MSDHSGVQVSIPGTSHFATTDSTGNWNLSFVPAGKFTLLFEKEGFAHQTRDASVISGQKKQLTEFVMSSSVGTISGTVLLGGITKNSSVLVALGNSRRVILAEEDGRYSFGNVPVGKHTLFFYSAGYEADKKDDIEVSSGTATTIESLTLKKAVVTGNLFGTITLENQADPVGASVLVVETGQSTVVTSQGGFLLTGMQKGTYTLEFFKEGFQVFKLGEQNIIKGVTSLITKSVTLIKSRGNLKGIALLDRGSNHAGIEVGIEGRTETTETDASGNFAFSDIPIGSYNLIFSKNKYVSSKIANVSVIANNITQTTSVTLEAAPGSISGNFNLEGEAKHTGITVSVGSHTVQTDDNGEFTLTEIPAGPRTLIATKSGFESYQAIISLSPGEVFSLDNQTLSFSVGTIKGVSVLQAATNHSGITVSVDGTTRSTQTNAAGDYQLSGIKQGSYTLSFTKPSYTSSTATDVNVAEGSTVEVTVVELKVKPGTFSGTFLKQGLTDHSGITVSVGGKSGMTNSMGAITIPDVPAGLVQLSAVGDGFKAYGFNVTMPANGSYEHPIVTLEAIMGVVAGKVNLDGSNQHLNLALESG